MSREELDALLLLAGFKPKAVYELANGYCSDLCCKDRPWWLLITEAGPVRIGWRKRVISIEWKDTPLRFEITKDETTRDHEMVHAWGWAKALEYLARLKLEISRHVAREAEKAATEKATT